MPKLIVECPLNPLSFGQVAINILRELYKRNIDVILFPIGHEIRNPKPFDIAVYDKLSESFKNWLVDSSRNRIKDISRDIPSLKLWHFDGAHNKISDNQYLYTFYECDSPTQEEINMINMQTHTFFSNQYNIDVFTLFGVDPSKISKAPLGFDPDFGVMDCTHNADGRIEFGLIGKWEKRKNTSDIIKTWVKKFGNDKRYMLNLAVTNPFLPQKYHDEVIRDALSVLDGKTVTNINFLEFMKTNTQVNQLMNFIDIDLGGMSSAEGWNLPSFHMTGLGKWSVVLNATSHMEWANAKNSIQIQPNGKQPIYDDLFFRKDIPYFNQGNSFTFDSDEFVAGLEKSITKAKTPNPDGLLLQEQFTWKKTVDHILQKIFG